jgi:hypothetical protein
MLGIKFISKIVRSDNFQGCGYKEYRPPGTGAVWPL